MNIQIPKIAYNLICLNYDYEYTLHIFKDQDVPVKMLYVTLRTITLGFNKKWFERTRFRYDGFSYKSITLFGVRVGWHLDYVWLSEDDDEWVEMYREYLNQKGRDDD